MQELVTIKTFNTHADLGVVQSYLEAAGIRCSSWTSTSTRSIRFTPMPRAASSRKCPKARHPEAARLLIEGGFAKPEDFEVPREMVAIGKALERIKKIFNKK